MDRPDHPTVADVLAATAAVADTHEKIAADHRAAIESYRPEPIESVESPDTESTAL